MSTVTVCVRVGTVERHTTQPKAETMRIHTSVNPDVIRDAASAAGVQLDRFTTHGSRSRARAYDVILTGSGAHMNSGSYGSVTDSQAATWDEWGIFLARVFAADPATLVPRVYLDADHFRWATGARYDTLAPADQHRRHRWRADGGPHLNVTRSYYVGACKCGAIRRTLARGVSWEAISGAA